MSSIKNNQKNETVHSEIITNSSSEINEVQYVRETSLEALKNLIKEEKDLDAQLDDEFLLRFLRARKYDIHRAFLVLKNYYKDRYDYPNIYEGAIFSRLEPYFNCQVSNFLPHRDKYGRRILLCLIDRWDPETYHLEIVMQAYISYLEEILDERETQMRGVVIIFKNNISISQIFRVKPSLVKHYAHIIQDSIPVRLKALHIWDSPFSFSVAWKIIKAFMKRKLRDRVYFHSDLGSLHEHFNPSILPAELGGSQPPMDNTEFVNGLRNSEDRYLERLKNYGYVKRD